MGTEVIWYKQVERSLEKLPQVIVNKFFAWVTAVRFAGIRELRKHKGYHDEPLKGNRKGQSSVRLNKAYRAIYIERNDKTVEFIEIVEVSKHEY